jgi:hypothetical protein
MPGGCGCAGGSCSCTVTAGPGLTISGTGNASSPFMISLAPSPGAITVAATGPLDLSANGGNSVVLVTLNASATSVVLPSTGGHLDILFIQGSGGSRTVTWPAAIVWPGGAEPVLTVANGAVDWITLVSAGGTWAGVRTGANLS